MPLSPLDQLRAGDHGAVGPLRDALRSAAGGDRGAFAAVLDPVAVEAAAGNAVAVEVVIWAVDELGLARPTIRGLVLDEADGDDVNQEVLIAVAESIGTWRGEGRFTSWLHPVARNHAIAFLRRKRDTAALADDDGPVARISSMIATRSALDDAIRAIPDPYRDAVILRDIEGLAYDVIADRLGVELNTVRSRINRGRALAATHLRAGTR